MNKNQSSNRNLEPRGVTAAERHELGRLIRSHLTRVLRKLLEVRREAGAANSTTSVETNGEKNGS
jgi:hypothetical protein